MYEELAEPSHPRPEVYRNESKAVLKVAATRTDSDKVTRSSAAAQPVAFEDYLHFSALQRLEEERAELHELRSDVAPLGSSSFSAPQDMKWLYKLTEHKGDNVNIDVRGAALYIPQTVEEEERAIQFRAMRLSSWSSIFYLLTTDIFGPANAPYAIAQLGWVPGIVLYTIMGMISFYTGLILWRLFLRLDSVRYPLRNYSDLFERIFGRKGRHICTILISLQLLFSVASICLASGQSLSQITSGRLCFSLCVLLWALTGMIIAQIRALKNYGWLASVALWFNICIMFIAIAFVARHPPDFKAAQTSLGVPPGPKITVLFTTLPMSKKVTGMMNMVYAYGGAMIFPEMMAEMKRPMDFWKAMTLAQLIIFSSYLFYGTYIYAFQGQFSLPVAFQGIGDYTIRTVLNVLHLLSVLIAAGLYGNVGLKIVYVEVVERLHGPSLTSQKGRILWTIMVVIYWGLAYLIGSAIPQLQSITGLIASVATMQFTFTFPILLRLGYDIITDAMSEDKKYSPGMGVSGRVDTWRDWSRWRRGIFGVKWYIKLMNLLMFLGGTAMACLGMWGAGSSVKETFQRQGAATAFGCKSPVM